MYIFIFILFLVVLIAVFGLFIVPQQSIFIIERFGKFWKTSTAGLNIKIPVIDKIAGKLNLRVSQLDVEVETKTKDNVFVRINVSVQFFVKQDKVYDAFYRLNNPQEQINAYIFDVVRARVPKSDLDNVFEEKDNIATAVREELSEVMEGFGYEIIKALVTDIDPNAKVKEAMNEINAAKRIKEAAYEKAEAEKIMKVKIAEADAESKALEGRGIADQRKAIIDGYRDSIKDFKTSITDSTSEENNEFGNVISISRYSQGNRRKRQNKYYYDTSYT